MAKQRAGYVFEDKVWYAVVEYKDSNGKRQSIKRRAKSQADADKQVARIINRLQQSQPSSTKISHQTFSQSEGWIARLTFTDETGNRRNVTRRAENKTAAKEELKKLINKLENQGEQALDGDKLIFRDLARVYKERKLVPAEYQGDRKVRGLRSYRTPSIYLKILTAFFGNRRIKSITHSDVEEFKHSRLNTRLANGKERTIASVNRELELLRAMLRFALRQGWILRSPFEMGVPIISKADEVRRERVLSHDEEMRLLAVCTGRRAHLKPLLIAALDTAARRGELFKLIWTDVDFGNRLINEGVIEIV